MFSGRMLAFIFPKREKLFFVAFTDHFMLNVVVTGGSESRLRPVKMRKELLLIDRVAAGETRCVSDRRLDRNGA